QALHSFPTRRSSDLPCSRNDQVRINTLAIGLDLYHLQQLAQVRALFLHSQTPKKHVQQVRLLLGDFRGLRMKEKSADLGQLLKIDRKSTRLNSSHVE